MIRFEVNGEYLDLPADFSLQFKKTNILFAFDDIECERSTSFDIPATPKNDRIFALAKWVQNEGDGMRRRYEAQMQAGLVVLDGYLHIDQFNAGTYKAVFVTGELFGLLKVREAGSVRDFLHYNSTITWNDNGVVPANVETLPNVALVNYSKKTAHVNPSVALKWLIQQAAASVGVSVDFINTDASERIRLFNSTEDYEMDEFGALISFSSSLPNETTISKQMGVLRYETYTANVWRANSIPSQLSGYEWDTESAELLQSKQFRQIVCNYDIEITFAEDTPENLCLVTGDLAERMNLNDDNLRIAFIDERRFYKTAGNVTAYTGTPLAGRKVTINAYTPFFLLSGDGYWYTKPTAADQEADIGYYIENAMSYVVGVEISVQHKWEYGEPVPYNAILPDLTLIELLKMYSYMTGTILTYDGTVKFEPLNFETYARTELSNVIEIGEIRRTFGDYAQENVVQYESADYVLKGTRIKTTYTVKNENIEQTKELAKLKASEGQREFAGALERVLIPSYDDNVTAANASTEDAKMLRVHLLKNAGIQRLCDASTSVQMRVQMTLLEFNQLQPKMALYYEGVRYVWTEANWTKNVATIKMSKIPA